jgi:two-component system sensor histidine kinase KdpD
MCLSALSRHIAAAVGFGALHGLTVAALSFLAWNYLFLPPRYTLAIASAQDVVGVVVFSSVSLLLAGTTCGLGRSVRAARARLLGLRRLVEFSRRLGAPGTQGDPRPRASRTLARPSASARSRSISATAWRVSRARR